MNKIKYKAIQVKNNVQELNNHLNAGWDIANVSSNQNIIVYIIRKNT